MSWEGWLTLVTIVMITAALVRNLAGPEVILLGGLTLLVAVGSLMDTDKLPSAADAANGFGNPGLVTIGFLYVVAGGLTLTGATAALASPMLGRPKTIPGAQARLMLPVAALSAFLNNTPIVAMGLPIVSEWSRKIGISPSRLFIPLSYAAIMGGTCTLIGTSTNLVVDGLLIEAAARGQTTGELSAGMSLWEISKVGVPNAVLGITYVLIASRWLLPQRTSPQAEIADAKRYTVEMLVQPGSPIVGKTIEKAGLRHLPGLFLAEIERQGDDHDQRLVAVGPDTLLEANDRLIFVGVVDSVVDLQKIRGLVPATTQVFKLQDPRPNRQLIEAVVANSNPLVGKSIREGRFRSTYDAAVIAVHRAGHHVDQKVGDIVLRPGDTLLIEAHPRFLSTQRARQDFYLVSEVPDSQPLRHERAWLAMGVLIAMVTLVTAGLMSLLPAAMLAAAVLVLTRCIRGSEARAAVEWRVLLVIGAALGLGKAVQVSGMAEWISSGLLDATGWAGPIGVLLGVYLLTMLFTELIGNIGAAVLAFPIAMVSATQAGLNGEAVSPMPFVIVVMISASASFATPIGYQTNLMVYGPGGYRFTDYLRFGLPLNLLIMTSTILLAPLIWPF